MSSVLDIKYKTPTENKGSIQMSLLGGSAYFEGITINKRFSYIMGFRNKSNQYLLNAMDTERNIAQISQISRLIYNIELKITGLLVF